MSNCAVTNELLLETLQSIQNDVSVMRRDLQSLQGTVEAMELELRVDAGLEQHDRPARASTMKGFQPFGVSWYEWVFVTVLVLFSMWFGANVL